MGSPGDYQESFASAGTLPPVRMPGLKVLQLSDMNRILNRTSLLPQIISAHQCQRNGWSCGYSGTSVASPHSAGAVALLWSCNLAPDW